MPFAAAAGILPAGYQRVEYIQSTGAQWIDTDYVPVAGRTSVDISFGSVAQAYQTIFAQTTSIGSGGGYCFIESMKNYQYYFEFNGTRLPNISTTADYRVTVAPGGSVTVDAGTGPTAYACADTAKAGVTLAVFGDNNTSRQNYPGKFKLYRMTIAEDGAVVRDFIPCRKDDKPGLFDLAHAADGDAAFYVNKLSGTDFTLGADYIDFDFTVADSFDDGQASYAPAPVITDRDSGKVLPNGDFDIVYADNTALGVATVTVTGKAGTAYASQKRAKTFEILPIYRVAPAVGTDGDGQTWDAPMSFATAYATVCASGGAVWMKSGDYPLSASLAKGTLAHSVAFFGGFAGTEAHASGRPAGARSTLDGGGTYGLLSFDNAAVSVEVDRLDLIRSSGSGLAKTGKGNLTVRDCAFRTNGRGANNVNGRGIGATGSASAVICVSNCWFEGNLRDGVQNIGSGSGIYLSNCARAFVEDCHFVTNGASMSWNFAGGYGGAAVYAGDTPLTMCRCRIAGNVGWYNQGTSSDGGAVKLSGRCGGSAFTNCVWSGNCEKMGRNGTDSTGGGALAVSLASSNDTVDVKNCTFAYNIASTKKSAAGLTVYKGTVSVRDSVFFGNANTSGDFGADIGVGEAGYLTLDYSSFAGTGETFITHPEGHADFKDSTLYAFDPLFVTSAADGTAARTTASYASLESIDCHLLSRDTYRLNDGSIGPATESMSPAIDKGDPDADYSSEASPNGGRLNLGAYGNTLEASTTAVGVPKVDSLEVEFPNGVSLPCITLKTGIASGSDYSATVTITCTTNGVVVAGRAFTEVVNGATIYYTPNVGLLNGDELKVSVSFVCAGGVSASDDKTVDVTGEIAPWIGKGGGPTVIHVRPGAYGMNDGTSWADAYTNIVEAFDVIAADVGHAKRELWLSGAFTNTAQTLTLSAAVPFAVRGGFTGAENAPTERASGRVASIDNEQACNGLTLTVSQGVTATVDRVCFAHGYERALNKGGAGSLELIGCVFEANGCAKDNADGRGCLVSGGSTGSLVARNCVFRGNYTDATSNAGGCGGISVSACSRATLDNCLFVTNGSALSTGFIFTANGGCCGALAASATPVTARNCRFIGNTGCMRGGGGCVRLSGACGGSAFTNCLWIGNADWSSRQGGTSGSGALVVALDSVSARVDLKNCTIAYNLFGGTYYENSYGMGGLNVVQGDVSVRDSIIFGNQKGVDAAADCGTDIDVKTNSVVHLAYSLVPTLADASAVHGCTPECLDIATGTMVTGDPLFVSTTNDFAALHSGGWVTPAKRLQLVTLCAHLRGGRGYFDENLGVLVREYARGKNSPAIDAGDPASDYKGEPECGVGGNGRRINLGCYGNTSWATMSRKPGTFLVVR